MYVAESCLVSLFYILLSARKIKNIFYIIRERMRGQGTLSVGALRLEPWVLAGLRGY